MKNRFRGLIVLLCTLWLVTGNLFGEDIIRILKQLDKNEVYNTIRYNGTMIIYNEGKTYRKSFETYAKGSKNFYMEFTNQDDIGTKYLKKDGNLYVYSEDLEKTLPITGHMLKESMMGSDLSYEDTVENEKLTDLYDGIIVGESIFGDDTNFKGQKIWLLKLIPKVPARINQSEFTKKVLARIISKKKKERAVKLLDTYYEFNNGIYTLKPNLDDGKLIKIHYKLSSLKYIKSAPYGKQMIWVGKDKISALKVEMYSASGKNKIKEYLLLDAKEMNGRYFPIEFQLRNLLRNDTKTVFQMNNIELDIDIADSMFNLKNLE